MSASAAQSAVPAVRAVDDRVGAAVVAEVEGYAARALSDLRASFPGTALGRFSITVHRDESTLPPEIRDSLHPGTAGVALLRQRHIHVLTDAARRRAPYDLRTVVEHEIVHLLLDARAGAAGPWVPRWFHEGLAQHLTGRPYLDASEETLVFRAAFGRLPTLLELRTDFPGGELDVAIAYAMSFSLVSYLAGEVGLPALLDAAALCDDRGWYRRAFYRATGQPMEDLEQRWLEHLRGSSGAGLRFLQQNCFSYLMIGAFVLLAMAGIRVWARDEAARERLAKADDSEDDDPESTPVDSLADYDRDIGKN